MSSPRPGLSKGRLLLVELMPHEPERQMRAATYPFLLGLARFLGWRASWCALGVRYEPTLRYRLPPEDLGLLCAEAARRRPDVIVINEQLEAGQRDRLDALARLIYCPIFENLGLLGSFFHEEILAMGRRPGPDLYPVDRIEPCFQRRPLNAAARATPPLVRVMAGPRCVYRRPASSNRFYRGLGLPSGSLACAFCYVPPPERVVRRPLEFAVREVAAACRQLPGAERRFEIVGCEVWRRLEEFVAALARAGVRRAELSFMPRIEELLAARAVLRRCLPRLARRGLALRLYGMGVENFSPEENLRLNKGITAGQVHEAVAFVMDMLTRWPRHFRYPSRHLSMILFTPWTSLADLRLNLSHIERCPLIHPATALRSRLQLFPDRPVTVLARRDGLVAPRRGGRFYNSGCIVSADQNEIPWRFRHPEVGVLWALALALNKDVGRDPLPVFRRALDLMSRRPAPRTLPALQDLLTRAEKGAKT